MNLDGLLTVTVNITGSHIIPVVVGVAVLVIINPLLATLTLAFAWNTGGFAQEGPETNPDMLAILLMLVPVAIHCPVITMVTVPFTGKSKLLVLIVFEALLDAGVGKKVLLRS